MASILAHVSSDLGRVALTAAFVAIAGGCATNEGIGGPQRFAYPRHIEFALLDKGRRIFVVDPASYELRISPGIRYVDFRYDSHKTVYALAGIGEVSIGRDRISVSATEVRVNDVLIEADVATLVVRPDGSVVPNAMVGMPR